LQLFLAMSSPRLVSFLPLDHRLIWKHHYASTLIKSPNEAPAFLVKQEREKRSSPDSCWPVLSAKKLQYALSLICTMNTDHKRDQNTTMHHLLRGLKCSFPKKLHFFRSIHRQHGVAAYRPIVPLR